MLQAFVPWFARLGFGSHVADVVIDSMMTSVLTVHRSGVDLSFSTPNRLCLFRAETFASKEPETLDWIDTFADGSILWDVGANIGLYSIYAAKARHCQVYAFEPSVFNVELLARNINLNSLQETVTIIPVPLIDKVGISAFKMTSTAWGGALSTFREDYNHFGQPLKSVFEYRSPGLSMSAAVATLGIPAPDYLKIDVDGIEHLVLRGGTDILNGVKSVLIEIDDNFTEQAEETTRLLGAAGLTLTRKSDPALPTIFNQLWIRR